MLIEIPDDFPLLSLSEAFQPPTPNVVKMTSLKYHAPVFENSDEIKIVGFKASNQSDRNFEKVSEEWILKSDSVFQYLGDKKFILPIYEAKK